MDYAVMIIIIYLLSELSFKCQGSFEVNVDSAVPYLNRYVKL